MPDRIIFTTHAEKRLRERAIDKAEIEYAVAHASVQVPGKNPGTIRIIAEMGFERKLSVIYKRVSERAIVVVSAYWVEGQP